jgi:uncharacterized membrane protein
MDGQEAYTMTPCLNSLQFAPPPAMKYHTPASAIRWERAMAKDSRQWPETPTKRIIIVPNRSISAAGLCIFFSMMGTVTLLVAGWFAWFGFWPILVYAVAELGWLAYCLRLCVHRTRYSEIITITPERVVVEQGEPEHREVMEFSRMWARVIMRKPSSRLASRQVLICSHGRGCEVGLCLTDIERGGLSRRLGELIGEVAAAPPLADDAN